MSANDTRQAELAALTELLDSHGGHAGRWPETARVRFRSLIASDPAARRLVAEARALDRLLMHAPTVTEERGRALTGRIVAAAAADRGHVVDLARHRPARAPSIGFRRRGMCQAAGMMAASLVAGVIIGMSGGGSSVLDDLASLLTSDTDTLTTTLNLAVGGNADEDTL